MILFKKLKNKAKIIRKKTQGQSDIVGGILIVKGGQIKESKKGLTNILYSLITKRTKKYNFKEIGEPFEDCGGAISSFCSSDFGSIEFATKIKNLDKALEKIKSILEEPYFEEDLLKVQKNKSIIEIRSKKENPFEFAFNELRKITYKGTPYESSVLGEEKDIENISTSDLYDRFKEMISPENIVFSIASDKEIDIEKLEALLNGLKSEKPIIISPKNNIIKNTHQIKIKRGGEQSTIIYAFNAPSIKNKEEYFGFKVLSSYLGGGMSSLFFRELREKKGYAYATSAFYEPKFYASRLFCYIGTSKEKTEKAASDMLSIIENLKFDNKVVKLTKNRVIGSYLLSKQTKTSIASSLASFEILGFSYKTDENYKDYVEKVDIDLLNYLKDKYINHYNCVIVEP